MLKELFEEIPKLWRSRTVGEKPMEGSPVYDYFKGKLEPTISKLVMDLGFKDFVTKASVGMGNWAEIPWVGIRHDNVAHSFEQGQYVVYLFSPDFNQLHLGMIQGVSELEASELNQKAAQLRGKFRRPGGFQDNIAGQVTKNRMSGSTPDKYEKGLIFVRTYGLAQIPNDEQLLGDLKAALESYQEYIDAFKLSDIVFWKFSPGTKASLWRDFERRGIIAMGSAGKNLGSLNNYPTVEDLQNVPNFPTSPNPRADYAHQLVRFRDEVKPGNVIIAYGNKSIYCFGIVPEDSTYQFDDKEGVDWWGGKQPGMQHWRKVDWMKVLENPIDVSGDNELYRDLSQNDTIHRVSSALAGKLQGLMGGIGSSSGYPTREQVEKAIRMLRINSISREDLLNVLEKMMAEENITMKPDWKSKTWDNIKLWAEKIVQ